MRMMPTTRLAPLKSTPMTFVGKDLRVLRADGRSPACRFFGPRPGRNFRHHLALTTCAASSEVPQRLQNFRVVGLPSPHSGQTRSPGSSRRVGGRRWIETLGGRAAVGRGAAGWWGRVAPPPGGAAGRVADVASGRSRGRPAAAAGATSAAAAAGSRAGGSCGVAGGGGGAVAGGGGGGGGGGADGGAPAAPPAA